MPGVPLTAWFLSYIYGMISKWRLARASGAHFMGKLPVFLSGLYGATARKTGDLHNFSLNKYIPG